MNCPKHTETELVNMKIKSGKYVALCPECKKKYSWSNEVDTKNYYYANDGSIRRRIPKTKLSKAERKRRTKEKHAV